MPDPWHFYVSARFFGCGLFFAGAFTVGYKYAEWMLNG